MVISPLSLIFLSVPVRSSAHTDDHPRLIEARSASRAMRYGVMSDSLVHGFGIERRISFKRRSRIDDDDGRTGIDLAVRQAFRNRCKSGTALGSDWNAVFS